MIALEALGTKLLVSKGALLPVSRLAVPLTWPLSVFQAVVSVQSLRIQFTPRFRMPSGV